MINNIPVKYDVCMDPECIPLCAAINELDGFATFESCCGHGRKPFWIWLDVDKPDFTGSKFYEFVRAFNKWYGGEVGWKVMLDHIEATPERAVLWIEGPPGAYESSYKIADYIRRVCK